MLHGMSKKVMNLVFLAHKGIQKAILKVSDQARNIEIILVHPLSPYHHLKVLTELYIHVPSH